MGISTQKGTNMSTITTTQFTHHTLIHTILDRGELTGGDYVTLLDASDVAEALDQVQAPNYAGYHMADDGAVILHKRGGMTSFRFHFIHLFGDLIGWEWGIYDDDEAEHSGTGESGEDDLNIIGLNGIVTTIMDWLTA